jgi:hypothetical protein
MIDYTPVVRVSYHGEQIPWREFPPFFPSKEL